MMFSSGLYFVFLVVIGYFMYGLISVIFPHTNDEILKVKSVSKIGSNYVVALVSGDTVETTLVDDNTTSGWGLRKRVISSSLGRVISISYTVLIPCEEGVLYDERESI